jgi:trehalose-6-phosphate synthase
MGHREPTAVPMGIENGGESTASVLHQLREVAEVTATRTVLGSLGPGTVVSVANRSVVQILSGESGIELRRAPGGLGPSLEKALRQSGALVYCTATTDIERLLCRNNLAISLGDGLWIRYVAAPEKRFGLFYNRISSLFLYLVHHDLGALLPSGAAELLQEGSAERLARAWDRLYPRGRVRPGPEVFNSGFRRAWDAGYRWVNSRYADIVAEETRLLKAPRLLVHDYHFHLLPSMLRQRGFRGRMTLFYHIPWPEPQAFLSPLPEPVAQELLVGCMGSDAVGFHVSAYCECFLVTAMQALGKRVRRAGHRLSVLGWNREHQLRTFAAPISLDPKVIEREVLSDPAIEFLQQLRSHMGDRLLLVRAERIDPIKGLVEGIEAFDLLLTRRPDLVGRINLLAVLQPSRLEIPLYRALLEHVHGRAASLAARFGPQKWDGVISDAQERSHLFERPWPPVVLYEAQKPFAEVVAAMAASDLGLFNSLADGMNLAVKEFLLVNDPQVISALRGALVARFGAKAAVIESGTAIVSERLGAAQEISECAIVLHDPRDVSATSRLLENEIDHLLRHRGGNSERARKGAQRVRAQTIDDWLERVLGTFGGSAAP